MSNLKYANFALSKLAKNADVTDTQLHINDDALFPSGSFTAVIWSAGLGSPLDDSTSEIVTMTRSAEGVFDTVRAEEETTPRKWQKGANIANVATADTMNLLHFAAGALTSTSEISADIYEMSREYLRCNFNFSDEDTEKSVTLPEKALCGGLTFTLHNNGTASRHQVKLSPCAGDSFADTSKTFISIPAGATMEMTASDTGWKIRGINSNSYNSLRIVDSADYNVTFTEGVIYADSSAGEIELSLPDCADAYGIPLTFIKYDDSGNYFLIDSFDGPPYRAVLNGQYESATFVIEPDGRKRLLNVTAPKQKSFVTLYEDKLLAGHERYAFCYGGANGITVDLPFPDIACGRTVTVKKIDSEAGAVMISPFISSIDGDWQTVDLTSQWEYATFSCDGEQWFRVG
ncbi:hypothetical protein Dacet_2239 [Denitrovibrio acetiphilus DSM 12809]|uniref:Uncharacterized protein n=1 Tax=Denitrovibrio acetiphilus (strain DSM 12809 / NBRC 114555 / N2460) TaxID=522772 RepID=D4H2X8_DENA2|nr:hypothetical protein [Denitrovibrio acetiphilus]ADD69001.1 hypothetical protein Dacet_2239 [Denitrovibrio acetiphilus DSM 12809]